MALFSWQLEQALDAVVFDCDATLSQIEGIDVLAAQNGVGEAVIDLTEQAMGQQGISLALYQERLALVQPSAQQVRDLSTQYYQQLSPHVAAVIGALQRLGKTIYVISAGIRQAVVGLAEQLSIPAEQVFAVEVWHQANGQYADFDQASPLTRKAGKRQVIEQLKKINPRMAHVGDGMNDVAAVDIVERFIGYGGVAYRANIAEKSDFYIKDLSLAAVLCLSITAAQAAQLTAAEQVIFNYGLMQIQQGKVEIHQHERG